MSITRGSITAGRITSGGILAGGILASQAGGAYRDYAFYLDGALDRVSGRSLSCLIPGTRYDLVNGVQTAFTENIPVVTEKGIRSVGAYQNFCKQSNNISSTAWTKYTDCTTPSYDIISGFDSVAGDRISQTILPGVNLAQVYMTLSFEMRSNELEKKIIAGLKRDSGTFVETKTTFTLSSEWEKKTVVLLTLSDSVGLRLAFSKPTTDSVNTFNIRNIQVSQKRYPLPFIPTTSTSVASVSESGTVVAGESTNGVFADEIASNFTLLNSALQSQSTLTLDWTPGYSASDVTGPLNILSFDGSTDNLRYNKTTGAIELFDGTNTASKAITPVANATYTVQCTWQGSSMQVCVDGSAGTTATFDGSFNPGSNLVYGLNNAELQYIKNPKVLKEPEWV